MRRETGSMMWLKIEMLELEAKDPRLALDLKGIRNSQFQPIPTPLKLETISRNKFFDNNLCRRSV